MALITSCQATFQNFSGYEDDLASLEENIRECYSEITKTSEQINMSVREEFISRSEMETIQKDFETSITQSRNPDGFHYDYGRNQGKCLYEPVAFGGIYPV